MSLRYNWHLVENAEIFVDNIIKRVEAHPDSRSISAKAIVWRAYSRLLYNEFLRKNNEAAQELFGMFVKTIMLMGKPPEVCEEIAQEGILRVLARLNSVRSPEGFLTWALRILRSCQREIDYQADSLESVDEKPIEQVVDEEDLMEAINTKINTKEIASYIQTWLPNQLERIVLLRTIINGDNPRDIAQELNMPHTRIRVAKSRALKRLRDEPEFLAWLRNLSLDSNRALP